MPHLQASTTTTHRAQKAARKRAQSRLLAATHTAAIQRANTICAREPGVISIYALGLVISQIEADQIHHHQNHQYAQSYSLTHVIRRLQALLPKI